MKRILLQLFIQVVLMIVCAIFSGLHAQTTGVGINKTGAVPDASAMLDIQSEDKGFLMPRLSSAQRDAIVNPAPGLYIFNLTDSCFNYFTGKEWVKDCGRSLGVDTDPLDPFLLGGNGLDEGYSIETDLSGNMYLAGAFENQIVIGSDTLTSSGQSDIFLAKYSPAGQAIWGVQAGGSDLELPFDLALDPAGNCYITGGFLGTSTFGNTNLTSAGSVDGFVAKYDSDGQVLWATQFQGSNTLVAEGISLDNSGNAYVTGNFTGAATMGGISLNGFGARDIFLAKLNPSGQVLWAREAGGMDDDQGYEIVTDAAGNSFVTGTFRNSAIFSTISVSSVGGADLFVAKYDPSGQIQWVQKSDGPGFASGHGIDLDDAGNIYVGGSFSNSESFGSNNLSASAGGDGFLLKYNATGQLQWATDFGAGNITVNDIRVDQNGNSYLTGRFFNSMIQLDTVSFSSQGIQDIFALKVNADGKGVWGQVAVSIGSGAEGRGIALDGAENCWITGYFSDAIAIGSDTISGNGREVLIWTLNASDGGTAIRRKTNVSDSQDGDTDSTNELQTLSFVGTDLTLSDGNTVPLANLQDNLGNHTAITDVNLANFNINNGGIITANAFAGDGSNLTNLPIGVQQGTGGNTLNLRAANEGVLTGNTRGAFSVDLQVSRDSANKVASGIGSAISGGYFNKASGPASTIGGGESNSAQKYATVVSGGLMNHIRGDGKWGAIGGGFENVVTGQGATIPGGISLEAPSYGETVVGLHNEIYVPAAAANFDGRDRVFSVGNGVDIANRSNAMTILKNGNVGLGISDPIVSLDIAGTINTRVGARGSVLLSTPGGNPGMILFQNNETTGDTLSRYNLFVDELNRWRFTGGSFSGGDVSNSSMTILQNGSVGIGTLSPQEQLEVNGAIKLGNTTSLHQGAIRYSGQDFEGYMGGKWHSLTGSLERSGTLEYGQGSIALDAHHDPVGGGYVSAQSQWQSFTALKTGYLTRIDILLLSYLGTLNYSLYEGEGTGGTLLKSGTFPTNPAGWFTLFDLNDQSIWVEKGKRYTIQASRPSGLVRWYAGSNSSGNQYSGGNGSRGFRTYADPTLNAWEVDTVSGSISLGNHTITILDKKVGINTETPEYTLDVNGTARFGGFNTANQNQGSNVIWLKDAATSWDEGLIKAAGSSGAGSFNRPGFGIHMNSTKQFGFWSSGYDQLFTVLGGSGDTYIKGKLGIGTTTPTRGKVEIVGSASYPIQGTHAIFNITGNGFQSGTSGALPFAIYAEQRIAAAEYRVHSDARIKHVQGISNSQADLSTLMKIEIADYQMIDTIAHGSSMTKKVIAQQVHSVYPEAVSTTLTEVVPDIFQTAEVKDGWIMLPTDLQPGDRVKLITKESNEVYEVLEAEPTRFKVAQLLTPNSQLLTVFVYGREVQDFHMVDYDALSMLNISATQQQQKLIEGQQEEIETLKKELAQLKALLSQSAFLTKGK